MNPSDAATPLNELLQALSQGLSQPRHAWQIGVMAAAFVLAVTVVQLWRRWLPSAARLKAEVPLAGRGVAAVLEPLTHAWQPALALTLMALGEAVLRQRQILHARADAHLMHLVMMITAAWMVVRVLIAILNRVVGQTGLVSFLERVIRLCAAVGLVLYATGLWDDAATWMSATTIALGTNAQVSVWSVLVGAVTTLVSLLVAMWLGALVEARLAEQDGLEPNVRTVLSRVLRAVFLLAALMLGLALSGIDLTILSVFGGALGVGLGLGLQRIASNYVSGFILLLDHSLRIGDFVAVDKFYGRVTRINTRYTVLRANDGTDAVVPNEMLVSAPVSNLTLSDPRLCLTVAIPVAPDTDLRRAIQVMSSAAAGVGRVLPDPAADALFREVAGGVVWFDVTFWIQDPQNGRQRAQSDVAVAVIEALKREGLAVAAPRVLSS
jgi:small-conductance mechanosensitive channel